MTPSKALHSQPSGLDDTALPTLGGLRVAVFSNLADVGDAWSLLQRHGHVTQYQTLAWCSAWVDTISQRRGILPQIVLLQDEAGQPHCLLPLQLRKRYGLLALEWLSTPDCAYGSPLFSDSFLHGNARGWFADHFDALLALLQRHDFTYLASIPQDCSGVPHPLMPFFTLKTANRSHLMGLQRDYQALLAQKRSGETRRSMRRRDGKLAELGQLTFGLPQTPDDIRHTISTMFADQAARLAESGIHNVFGPDEQTFIHALAQKQFEGQPALRPYTLKLDGTVLCVMLGGRVGDTFTALISSLASSPARKFSPGDHALRRMIEALCEDGVKTLDLSAGDTAYKLHWSDSVRRTYHMVRGRNLPGMAAAAYVLCRHAVKRMLKANPLVLETLYALRRQLSGTASDR